MRNLTGLDWLGFELKVMRNGCSLQGFRKPPKKVLCRTDLITKVDRFVLRFFTLSQKTNKTGPKGKQTNLSELRSAVKDGGYQAALGVLPTKEVPAPLRMRTDSISSPPTTSSTFSKGLRNYHRSAHCC